MDNDNEEHLLIAWNKLVEAIKTLPQNEQSILIIFADSKMRLQSLELANAYHRLDIVTSELDRVLKLRLKEIMKDEG